MHQAAQALSQIHEGAIGHDALHLSFQDAARRYHGDPVVQVLLFLLLQYLLGGEHKLLLALLHGDDMDFQLPAHESAQILHIAQGQMGGGNEAPDALQESHHAFVHGLADLDSDDSLVIHIFLHLVPANHIRRFHLGQLDIARAVVLLHHHGFYHVAHMHILQDGEGGILAHIRGFDHARCIIVQIQGDALFVHIDDGTGEHIPLLDDPEGCLQLLAVVLHGLRGADFLCLRWFFRGRFFLFLYRLLVLLRGLCGLLLYSLFLCLSGRRGLLLDFFRSFLHDFFHFEMSSFLSTDCRAVSHPGSFYSLIRFYHLFPVNSTVYSTFSTDISRLS